MLHARLVGGSPVTRLRLYDFANRLLYDHFASEDDGVKFLDRNTLWLDVVLKLFFFASVWQASGCRTASHADFHDSW